MTKAFAFTFTFTFTFNEMNKAVMVCRETRLVFNVPVFGKSVRHFIILEDNHDTLLCICTLGFV